MAEPLKKLYTQSLIETLSDRLLGSYSKFDSSGFVDFIFDDDWPNKELKQRMYHISNALYSYLPKNYQTAISILKGVSHHFDGFEHMFFPGFVELYGLDHYDISIDALEHFTPNSSSEFAVRPFILKYEGRMMAQMERWAESKNHQVRRLASEGCRPRLPWAMALPSFKQDPTPIIPILERLKDDASDYVRRSVANNLNDISKDNSAIVVELVKRWKGTSKQRDWVVKHGCRTLLKQAEPSIMTLFGFLKPDHITLSDFFVQKKVVMGEHLSFSFILRSPGKRLGKLRIEYGIDLLRKNSAHSRKLFKLSEFETDNNEKRLSRNHHFRHVTTRNYYPGIQRLAIVVNGVEVGCQEFELFV